MSHEILWKRIDDLVEKIDVLEKRLMEQDRRILILETNPLPIHDHSQEDTYFLEE
jgi:hypothetical protein